MTKDSISDMDIEKDIIFRTESDAYVQIRFNSLDNGEVERIFQSAENAILAEDGIDPVTGKYWTELIDLDSWVKKYLVEEIFGGIDAGVWSQYFFYQGKKTGGKIHAGPVWDYDAAMSPVIGMENDVPVINVVPEMFFAHRNLHCPWFNSLYYKDEFYEHLTELYRQKFGELLTVYLEERIPQYQKQILQSARLNEIRWQCGDNQVAVEVIHDYLADRAEFLKKIWSEKKKYVEVHVDYTYDRMEGTCFSFDYNVIPGECMPPLLTADTFTWYIAGTDIPFDNNQPIFDEMWIELRRE